jgi:hypothetical protein
MISEPDPASIPADCLAYLRRDLADMSTERHRSVAPRPLPTWPKGYSERKDERNSAGRRDTSLAIGLLPPRSGGLTRDLAPLLWRKLLGSGATALETTLTP